jgi:hypothetical protein
VREAFLRSARFEIKYVKRAPLRRVPDIAPFFLKEFSNSRGGELGLGHSFPKGNHFGHQSAELLSFDSNHAELTRQSLSKVPRWRNRNLQLYSAVQQ